MEGREGERRADWVGGRQGRREQASKEKSVDSPRQLPAGRS